MQRYFASIGVFTCLKACIGAAIFACVSAQHNAGVYVLTVEGKTSRESSFASYFGES